MLVFILTWATVASSLTACSCLQVWACVTPWMMVMGNSRTMGMEISWFLAQVCPTKSNQCITFKFNYILQTEHTVPHRKLLHKFYNIQYESKMYSVLMSCWYCWQYFKIFIYKYVSNITFHPQNFYIKVQDCMGPANAWLTEQYFEGRADLVRDVALLSRLSSRVNKSGLQGPLTLFDTAAN